MLTRGAPISRPGDPLGDPLGGPLGDPLGDPLGELAGLKRWVAWREEPRGGAGKPTKVPYSARGGLASTTNPASWASRAEAEARAAALLDGKHKGGVGITLGALDDALYLCGLDLDSSLDADRFTGARELAPWAAEIVATLGSYAEISPSGRGIKAFFRVPAGLVRPFLDQIGVDPAGWGCRRSIAGLNGANHGPAVEIYAARRYFAVTGRSWDHPERPVTILDQARLETLAGLIPKLIQPMRGEAGNGGIPDDLDEPGEGLDDSRSGMAWRAAYELAAETYEDMRAGLAAHPDAAVRDWVRDKGQALGERELRRIWQRGELQRWRWDEPGEPPQAPGVEAPAARPARALEFIFARDMRPQLDSPALIKGVLDREQISLLYGLPGSGKSFLAIDRDLSIAAGRDWFRHKVKPGRVVYLAIEAGRRTIQNRVCAWLDEHRVDAAELPFAAITSPVDLCRLRRSDVPLLLATIRERIGFETIALLEIDTVSRALAGGDENAPDDMGRFVRNLDLLREALHCHVSAVHHLGKDAERGPRGHSSLMAAVDTAQEVARLGGSGGGSGVSSYTITRQRDAMAGEKFYFRLPQAQLGVDDDGDLITTCTVARADQPDVAEFREPVRLTDGERIALTQLDRAVSEAGIPPGSEGSPAGKACVLFETWREFTYAGGIASSAKPEAKRQAFHRTSQKLIGAGIVGRNGDLVWRDR